jgi:hypothetical protein
MKGILRSQVLAAICRQLSPASLLNAIVIIIIIIGSTALREPWPSSESSASRSIRLLLLQIS